MRNKNSIIKSIIYFVLGGVSFGVLGVYAATTLLSQSVYYDNTTSGASSTNVQGMLDELYSMANYWVDPNNMGTPTNYAYGLPTTTSPTYSPSGKKIYAGLYADSQYGVCIRRSGNQYCFRANNWIAEARHVQDVFTGVSCEMQIDTMYCNASDFVCYVRSDGYVNFFDKSTNEHCSITGTGNVYCGL